MLSWVWGLVTGASRKTLLALGLAVALFLGVLGIRAKHNAGLRNARDQSRKETEERVKNQRIQDNFEAWRRMHDEMARERTVRENGDDDPDSAVERMRKRGLL